MIREIPILTFVLSVALLLLISSGAKRYAGAGALATRSTKRLKQTAMIVGSLAILGMALFVILSRAFAVQDKHWAYASGGTILGFWLRGGK